MGCETCPCPSGLVACPNKVGHCDSLVIGIQARDTVHIIQMRFMASGGANGQAMCMASREMEMLMLMLDAGLPWCLGALLNLRWSQLEA
jgi:hypothetical protein